MFKNLDLLSVRSLVIAAAAVLVLTVVVMSVSMLGPSDSGGLASDSFGTRDHGYRALFEILDVLEVSASRDTSPPQPVPGSRHTIVMLNPKPHLVEVGPKYLNTLQEWVEAGGRLVVSPSSAREWMGQPISRPNSNEDADDILTAIGAGVELVEENVVTDEYSEEDYTNGGADSNSWVTPAVPPPSIESVQLSGSLAPQADSIRELALPADGFQTLEGKPEDFAGAVTYTDEKGEAHLLVAIMERGQGQIVILSEPKLLNNRLIARADNSVLAAHLIAPDSRQVVFDEFYHGLAVRGNPLYLLTYPGYAAVTLCLLLLVGAAAWRAAVFLGPPLADTEHRRRDIGEYIHAMADFFSRGRGSRRFIVQEVRDGVLRQVCRDLRLPMDTLDLDAVTSALARRDRQRAARLAGTIREVDAALDASGDYPRADFLPDMQRLANCL